MLFYFYFFSFSIQNPYVTPEGSLMRNNFKKREQKLILARTFLEGTVMKTPKLSIARTRLILERVTLWKVLTQCIIDGNRAYHQQKVGGKPSVCDGRT